MFSCHMLPAYGRDYKSKKAVLADFDAGKDFIIQIFGQGQTYANNESIRDLLKLHPEGVMIQFRYKKLANTFVNFFQLSKDGKVIVTD
jgi:hypothetical protein